MFADPGFSDDLLDGAGPVLSAPRRAAEAAGAHPDCRHHGEELDGEVLQRDRPGGRAPAQAGARGTERGPGPAGHRGQGVPHGDHIPESD